MKQVARFVIGNPGQSDYDSINIVKSTENSPIVTFQEFGESKIHYDYAGNIFYENINKVISSINEIKSTLEKKTEVISTDYNLEVSKMLLNALEELVLNVKNFNIRTEQFDISADSFKILAKEIVLGNTGNVDYETPEESDFAGDSVLSSVKFKKFYNEQFIPFVEMVVRLFDNHIHIDPVSGVTDVPVQGFKMSGKEGETKVKEINKLKSSTAVKVI